MPNELRLPRAARLTGAHAFDRVFASRSARTGRHFRIHYVASEPGVDTPRFGMTVSKRVARRAVERNRVRRQIRESFRLHRGELARFDFVVRALPSSAHADRHELRRALDDLWTQFRSRPTRSRAHP